MAKSRTTRAFVSFSQCSGKMVCERAIPSSSTQNVLAQYLRRILTELLHREQNGLKKYIHIKSWKYLSAEYTTSLYSLKSFGFFAFLCYAYLGYAFLHCAFSHYAYLHYAFSRYAYLHYAFLRLFLTICMIPEMGFCPWASLRCIQELEHRISLLLFSFGLMHIQLG